MLSEGGYQNTKITEAILQFIYKDNLPFSAVEGCGFLKLMKTVSPRYKVPTRNTIKILIEKKYDVVSLAFKNVLKNLRHLSLTTDIWTDFQMRSFLGVTVHFIYNHKVLACALGVIHLEESHTSRFISERLQSLLNQWEITNDKIVAVVTDNGANIVKAITDTFSTDCHIRCFAHTLNLVCENALKNTEGLNDLITKVRSIVVWIKRSTKASDELRKYFKKEEVPEGNIKKMILDIKTRWNSTYYMLCRFVEMLPAVRHTSLVLVDSPTMTSAVEVETLKEIIKILQPIEKMTIEFSGEKYTTLSKVIPMLKCSLEIYANMIVTSSIGITLKNNVLKEMDKRFSKGEDNFLWAFSTVLDPRFKNIHLQDPMATEKLFSHLRNLISKIQETDSHSSSDSDAGSSEPATIDLWAHHKNVAHKSKKKDKADEITQYLDMSVASLNQDPLIIWEDMKNVYPNLFKLAEKVFTIPATSVPSERLFSKAGATATLNRNRLSPKMLGKLLFLGSLPEEFENI